MLRLPHGVAPLFENWLQRRFPERKDKVLKRIREMRSGKLYDSRFGVRGRGEGLYAEQVTRMFEVTCRRLSLNLHSGALSTAAFRRPVRGAQLQLFGRDRDANA